MSTQILISLRDKYGMIFAEDEREGGAVVACLPQVSGRVESQGHLHGSSTKDDTESNLLSGLHMKIPEYRHGQYNKRCIA